MRDTTVECVTEEPIGDLYITLKSNQNDTPREPKVHVKGRGRYCHFAYVNIKHYKMM